MKYKKTMKKKYEAPTVKIVKMEVTRLLTASNTPQVRVYDNDDEDFDPEDAW